MAEVTEIRCGIAFVTDDDDGYTPIIQISDEAINVFDSDSNHVLTLTQEELRGIMAIIAARQDKKSLYIRAASKQN